MKKLFLFGACFFLVAPLFFGSPSVKKLQAEETPCVRIYFDQSQNANYWLGKAYATFLQNLMGHFPQYQQIVSPIELYQPHDLDKCKASFYLGSYFNNGIPAAFFKDFYETQKTVVWLGYNIWNFPKDHMKNMWGHEYSHLTPLSTDLKDNKGNPSFFKYIHYKGEVFAKYGKYQKGSATEFLAPFEMAALKSTDGLEPSVHVLAEAEHSATKEKLPYVIENHNKYYVADIPFSFIHESDRYLVFADLLFDILQETPKHQKKMALIRLEDIHPLVPLSYLYSATNALKSEKIPIHISLIPIFFDPLYNYTRPPDQEFVTLTQVPEFMQFLSELKQMKATMIWHGSTHQTGNIKNPHSGVSGDDFEFWDANHNKILAEDSSDYVLDRLDAGFYDLLKADIVSHFWIAPHYQASPLDYYIFGATIPWSIGRVIYFNHKAILPEPLPNATDLIYSKDHYTKSINKIRGDYFRQFDVQPQSPNWYGQFYPYEIYGDVYGQNIIPENLGNSQPTENEHVVQPRSVEDILADAKRNLVLRDAWASVFYHVQLMNIDENGGTGHYPGDPNELLKLVRGIKALGYEFVNLDEFYQSNEIQKRSAPIYIQNSKEKKQ